MSTRSQRYIINPPTACPPHLRNIAGRPMSRVSFDIDEVARCAWSEILQTAPRSTSLFAFLEDLLAPGPNLVWRGSGPGRGTEMRRSFSGLFGRFFARSYLEQHHDFHWFAAIDGNNFQLSPKWRVSRKPRSKTEMPDWICARAGELAIGEAKGSHQKGNATRGGTPGPIKTADGQIKGVVVQKRVRSRIGTIWQSKQVKGWAVMSRWGLDNPSREPFLYALDPDTEGEPLIASEIDELVQAVARSHVEQIANGLGLLKSADDDIWVAPRRRVRIAEDQEKRFFAGAIITPFGPLDLDLDTAQRLSVLLPSPELVRFVGIEEDLLDDYFQGRVLAPRKRQRIGELSLIGQDGLVVAPVQQVAELS